MDKNNFVVDGTYCVPVRGYRKQYAVTPDGVVWSVKQKRPLTLRVKNGTPFAALYNPVKKTVKLFRVDEIVASTFVSAVHSKYSAVVHKDGNSLNCCADNLAWSAAGYRHRTDAGAGRVKTKPVVCVETGKIFESDDAAARGAGLCISSVRHVLHGRRDTAAGMHWRYAEEGEKE